MARTGHTRLESDSDLEAVSVVTPEHDANTESGEVRNPALHRIFSEHCVPTNSHLILVIIANFGTR